MKIMTTASDNESDNDGSAVQVVASEEQASSSWIDLETCTPAEFAMFLLNRPRFGNDERSLTEFMMQAVASLPHAEKIRDQLLQENAESEEEEEEEPEESEPQEEPVLSTLVSCWQPIRGKLRLDVFSQKGVVLTDEKSRESFRIQHAKDMVIFPKPEDLTNKRKTISYMLLIVFDALPFKNKQISQLVLQIPIQNDHSEHVQFWTAKLATELQYSSPVACIGMKQNKDGKNEEYEFTSFSDTNRSLTTAGLPFVSCFYNTSDGVLFPSSHGLLFSKPVMYLPRRNLVSIACSGTNRYVTMMVETNNDNDEGATKNMTYEFTNISTEERNGLEQYIQNTLIPAMNADGGKQAQDRDSEDDADENDEGVAEAVPEDEDDEIGRHGRKRRHAAIQAQKINRRCVQKGNGNSKRHHDEEDNDDDDDDDDYDYGEGEDLNEKGNDDDGDAEDDDDDDLSAEAEIDVEPSDTESDHDD